MRAMYISSHARRFECCRTRSLHFAVMFWRTHRLTNGITTGVAMVVLGSAALVGCGGSTAGGSSGAQAYCSKVKKLGDFTDKLSAVDVTDRAGTAKQLSDISTDIADIVSVAPTDIKPQWTVVGEIFIKLSAAMEASKDIDIANATEIDPKTLAALAELRTAPDELDKQGEAIDIYTKEACGFAIGS